MTDERAGLPSASSADMMYHCPGSVAAQQGLEPFPEEEAATAGVDIHAAMETGEDEGLGMTEKEITEKLRFMEARSLEQWKQEYHIEGEVQTWREDRFWLRTPTAERYSSSRPDFAAAHGHYGLVLNFKTGFMRLTPSEMSWQSRVEALSFWHEVFSASPVTNIRAGFVSSRLRSDIDVTDYLGDDLPKIEREWKIIIWRTQQKDAARVPGSWCRYCLAQGRCRENAVWNSIVLHSLPPIVKNDFDILQAVNRMTPQEMGLIYSRRTMIKSLMEAVTFRLKQLPREQLQQAGLELGKPRKNYPIEDHAKAFKWLVSFFGSEEKALQCIKVVRGSAEALLYESGNLTKDEVKQEIIKTLGLQMKEGEKPLKEL